MDTIKPTVVFVHGAWADTSGWDRSIRALRGKGFRAIGAANPLRELRSDAAYVAALLQLIEGPIVMVGHSYGGAVISNAATGNDQVQALVYINGWVPDEGESLIQLAQLNEGSLIPESLQPVPHKNADGSDVVDLYLDQEKFRAAFAGDVDPATAQVMAVAQRPFTETAFAAPSVPVVGRSVPSWYLPGHRGQDDPAGDAAVHGGAREAADRRDPGVARLDGVAARRRDRADPDGREPKGGRAGGCVSGSRVGSGFRTRHAAARGTTVAARRRLLPGRPAAGSDRALVRLPLFVTNRGSSGRSGSSPTRAAASRRGSREMSSAVARPRVRRVGGAAGAAKAAAVLRLCAGRRARPRRTMARRDQGS